jgi:putative FmdB family regulatory protein
MPIYEYRCKSCGKVFEVIHRAGERQLRTCRDCSGRLEKLVSRTAFLLKGGGWYAEGYSKDGGKKSSGEPSAEGGKKSAGDGSKKGEGRKQGGGDSGSSSGKKSASSGKD